MPTLTSNSQTGTPAAASLATSLVSSTSTTSAAFGLGQSQSPQGTTDLGNATTSRNPIASQRIIYGTRGQLGGTLTYVTTSETTSDQQVNGVPASFNGNLHMVITMAGHEITAFNGALVTNKTGLQVAVPLVIYLDGFQIPLSVNAACMYGGSFGDWTPPTDGGYYVPADYFPPNLPSGNADQAHDYRWRIRVEIDLGNPTETTQPFPLLAADTITGNPGGWSATCLQEGCAKAHVQLIWDSIRFNNSVPNVTFDVCGRQVYDPRTSTTYFSSNAALCLRDFLTDIKFGLGVNPALIDDTLTIAAANICDEAMVLREGGTQPRYSCNGVVEASVNRGEVLQKILDSMAGVLVPPADQWKMYAGGYTDPWLTITDENLRGPIKLDTAVSRKDLINGVKGTFISSDNNWQSADYPPYVNAAYVLDDGGTVTVVSGQNVYTGLLLADLALDFVTDPVQAQRLAKIRVEQVRRNCPLVLQCTMMAFQAEVNDVISFTHSRWGLSAATYLVTHTEIVLDDKGGAPVLGYNLVCIPWDSTVYEWDADTDEGTVVICTAPWLPDNTNVVPPTDLILTSNSSTTITRADGIAHSQILVQWTPPQDAFVADGGYIEIFIKEYAEPDTDYLMAGSAAGDADSFYIDTNITDGIDYAVQVQALNSAGSHSDPITGSVVCSGSASIIPSTGGPGPVGVANNDFEATSALPPLDWTVVGTPTLSYDISSQQQGLRSLIVASSTILDGVCTVSKYEVVPGDSYTGEAYKVGGYIKGDGVGTGIIVFRFFNAADVEVTPPIIATGSSPTPAEWEFYSAVGQVPEAAVYARVYLQNDTTTGTSVSLEFDSIVLFRVASLEDEVGDGPSRGAITAANASYRPLTNPLTAIDAGTSATIDIAAFTMRVAMETAGGHDISVNSGTVVGLSYATTYHVYYDDPSYLGGAVTYLANTTQEIALDATGRFYVGSILTPVAGGLPTTGNNDGGTGAQSGQLYVLSPTLRADSTTDPVTWYPANQADTDGNTSTYFSLNAVETIWLGGTPTVYSKWTSLNLKIHSTVVSVDAGGAAFCDYSLDDGVTWTNIFNVENGSQVATGAGAGASTGSGTAWTNPGDIIDPDNYATITAAAHGTTSQELKATDFGFAIPSGATIEGITVAFDEQVTGSAPATGEVGEFQVQLLKAGTPVGTPKVIDGTSTGTLVLGNNIDPWGTTWAYGDINNTNFGFELEAIAPTSASAWAPSTYYSPLAVIIDSNGNLQQVVTPGISGASHPTWSGTLSAVTTDSTGGLTWVMLEQGAATPKVSSLVWSAGTSYGVGDVGDTSSPLNPSDPGHFVIGGGCLFELTAGRMPRLGNMTVYIYPNESAGQGAFDKPYPSGNPPGSPVVETSINSLNWVTEVLPYDGSTDDIWWYAINGDGTTGIGIDTGYNNHWEAIIVGQMYFPKAGEYTFNLSHDDGMMMAFDPTMCTKVSGTVMNPWDYAYSASLGYPWMAGWNHSGSYLTDPLVINVLADGSTIGFEIGYCNWEDQGRLRVTCADATGTQQDIIPISTPLVTSATAPAWPAWQSTDSPSWPSVAESAGNYIWVNRGPVGDFAWIASTMFTAAGTVILDGGGYGQAAYKAGLSATTEPPFNENSEGLTADGSGLIWENDGARSAITSFSFAARNGIITVSYLPVGTAISRPATTDEVTLPLTQNLALVQVRYGLVGEAGEIQMAEVWTEAQAG
jgi:hypothetical protein